MPSFHTYTDLQLVESLKFSDEGAFTEIYHRYWEKLYKSAYIKLNDSEDAKEIVNDVLLDIWKRRADLSIEFLPAYLEKAVRFRVINHINRKKSTALLDSFETVLQSPFKADSQVNMNEFISLLEAWIAVLPEKQRRIFVKYYFDNLSTHEIAIDMNLSRKTVQNNLSMTVQYLKTKLKHLPVLLIMLSQPLR